MQKHQQHKIKRYSDLAAALPEQENSMKCVLCGRTPIETKIDPFPLNPEARGMLSKQSGIDPDDAAASYGVCLECRALPIVERAKLTALAIEDEREGYRRELNDEYRREAMVEALNRFRN
jgi:hypothetical protein